jgi:putative colanic acid biosynthesis glycosyltransferase
MTPNKVQEINCRELNPIFLSIVTVVRNDVVRLAKTIGSLESYYGDTRFEHIIIDGESGDGTLDLILDLKRHSNVKIISEIDNGLYDAMNKGIRLAAGEMTLFLNCGDEMLALPENVFSLRSHLLENLFDIICFPCLIDQGEESFILMPDKPIRHKTPTSHQAMFFSKSFLTNNLYDANYKIAADFDLFLRANTVRVMNICTQSPLTSIEVDGYASSHPALAYKEYLQVAYRRLGGIEKYFILMRIASKAVIAIFVKKLLPKKWVNRLRNLF